MKSREEKLAYWKSYREKNAEHRRKQKKAYYEENRERLMKKSRANYAANAERCRAYRNKYWAKHKPEPKPKKIAMTKEESREKRNATARKKTRDHGESERAKHRAYESKRRRENIQHKLGKLLRARIGHEIRKRRLNRRYSPIKNLGCTIHELKAHLESLWTEGMNWENHGKLHGCWHIDHILPLSSVDLTDPLAFAKVAHYTNLQPLWAKDNWTKGGRRRAFS